MLSSRSKEKRPPRQRLTVAKLLPKSNQLTSQGTMPKSRKNKIQLPQRHPTTRTLQKKKRMNLVISLTEKSRRPRRSPEPSKTMIKSATVMMTSPIRRLVHQLMLDLPLDRQGKQHPTSSLEEPDQSLPEEPKPSSVAPLAVVSTSSMTMAVARRIQELPDQLVRTLQLQKEAVNSSTCLQQPKQVIDRGIQKKRRSQRDQQLSSQLSAVRPT